MTGIYGGDGDQLSLQATFPQLRVLELEHGSAPAWRRRPPPSELPPFVSLRDGMGALVAGAPRLVRAHDLRHQPRGRASAAGRRDGYRVELADGRRSRPTVSSSRRRRT